MQNVLCSSDQTTEKKPHVI